jgi:hypothetical protein
MLRVVKEMIGRARNLREAMLETTMWLVYIPKLQLYMYEDTRLRTIRMAIGLSR